MSPKPICHSYPASVWSGAPRYAAAELEVDVEFEVVDLAAAANYSADYLKINPHATLPALTHGGKTFTNTIAVVDYLASISSKKVAAATSITVEVHEDKVDPNAAFAAARNEEELVIVKTGIIAGFTNARLTGLKNIAELPEAGPHKELYAKNIKRFEALDKVLSGEPSDDEKQKFFAESKTLWLEIEKFIVETLPAAIEKAGGPFLGGKNPGVDDFHVSAFFVRVVFVSGAHKSDEGVAVLEKKFGRSLPETTKAYWHALIARPSYEKAYPGGGVIRTTN